MESLKPIATAAANLLSKIAGNASGTRLNIFGRNMVRLDPCGNGFAVFSDNQRIGYTQSYDYWHVAFAEAGLQNPIGAYFCHMPTLYFPEGTIISSERIPDSGTIQFYGYGKYWGIRNEEGIFGPSGETYYLSDSYYYPVWEKPVGQENNRITAFVGPIQSQWTATDRAREFSQRVDATNRQSRFVQTRPDLLPGENIKTEEWLLDPQKLYGKTPGIRAERQLKIDLNIAHLATILLQEKREVYYIGLGQGLGSENCHFNITDTLLKTNFTRLIGVELYGMDYKTFKYSVDYELSYIIDPTTGKPINQSLSFNQLDENKYEAVFFYLGKQRTIIAYFKFDATNQLPVESYNILVDDSWALSWDRFKTIAGKLPEGGILMGYADADPSPNQGFGYYSNYVSRGNDYPMYYRATFVEQTSFPFYDLLSSEYASRNIHSRYVIYQKKK